MAQKIVLTQETRQALMEEPETLETVERENVQKELEEARALGDLSENAEYLAALDDRSRVETRIQQIRGILEQAEIV